ncbi:MAG: uncharacterized membrane protein YgdD (TMEM256/DUF423 family) [Urechidicola sp.]|jgi:uncharacterized membrane protein YgdD (TMEM256/DUF423 family)|tara:strand:+ start:14409 stop:14792 length:384 start_codon:yes stop_codon:yes gene_type:complete
MNKRIAIRGLVLIVVAIIFGAFLAHSLKEKLELPQLTSFETGVKYQFYGGLILLIFGLNWDKFKFNIRLQTNIFYIGVCLFSFSIYLLTLFSNLIPSIVLGPITPIGGSLMIISLVWIIMKTWKSKD